MYFLTCRLSSYNSWELAVGFPIRFVHSSILRDLHIYFRMSNAFVNFASTRYTLLGSPLKPQSLPFPLRLLAMLHLLKKRFPIVGLSHYLLEKSYRIQFPRSRTRNLHGLAKAQRSKRNQKSLRFFGRYFTINAAFLFPLEIISF